MSGVYFDTETATRTPSISTKDPIDPDHRTSLNAERYRSRRPAEETTSSELTSKNNGDDLLNTDPRLPLSPIILGGGVFVRI